MEEKKRDYLLPISVLIAALLISASLIYNTGKKAESPTAANLLSERTVETSPLDNLKPVSAADHIYGLTSAPVKIVEFSDLECPFCKSFHPVLKKIVADYGGQVAWVYRHFPIDQLHPKARKEAEATECAAELGGNDKFWSYVDRIFAVTPSNNGLDLGELPAIAEYVGLDKEKFQSCLDSGKYAERVAADLDDGEQSGAQGTPYSVVMAKDGRKYVIPGALPESQVKPIIERALRGQD